MKLQEKMDELNITNLSNCSNKLTQAQLKNIYLTGTTSSATCLLVITLILLLLIFYKACIKSAMQRLFLYLTIMTVIQEVCSMILNIERYTGTLCEGISFVSRCCVTVVYLLIFGMFVYLLYKIYEQFKGEPFPRLSRSKCCRVTLECLFIIIVLVFTIIWASLSDFGIRCRVTPGTVNDNCTPVGYINHVLAYVLYDLIGAFGVMIAIGLSIVFCYSAHKYRETRQHFMITLRRTLILLIFFAVCCVIETVALNFESYLYYGELYAVQLINAGGVPIFHLIFPLAFLFYFYSFNLFRWRAIKRAAAEWRCFRSCCERENAPRVGQLQEAATAPRSYRVTAPSATFFDVPHTGAFTDVTAEDKQQTCLAAGGGDAGYGTM